MKRVLGLAIAAIFLGTALSGCFGGTDTANDPPATKTPESPTPTAIVAYKPFAPTAGQKVTFDASGSSTGSVKVTEAKWGFGDGSPGNGLVAEHTYANPGSYVVTLGVTTDAGKTADNDAGLTYVQVGHPELDLMKLTEAADPVAIAGADFQVASPGTEISFSGKSSYGWVKSEDGFDPTKPLDPEGNTPVVKDAGNVKSFKWEFGDGAAPMEGNASVAGEVKHKFDKAGLYPVKLTVTNEAGKSGSFVYSVYILENAAKGGAKNPEVFVTATISGPRSVDPGFVYDTAGGVILQQVYETLVYYNRDNIAQLRPILVTQVPSKENGGISADGLTYTFNLKKGVKFHDGTEMKASDVKFSIDRTILMNDPESAAWISGTVKGADKYFKSTMTKADRDAYLAENGVQVVDDYTVRVQLDKPDPAFLTKIAFTQASILSKKAFTAPHEERASVWGLTSTPDGLPPPAEDKNSDGKIEVSEGDKAPITRDPWADRNMIGTGPFKFRMWIPNDRTVFDRFDDWHGHQIAPKVQDQKPALKTVILQYVDDLNTRLLMFKSGDADDIYVGQRDIDKAAAQIKGLGRIIEQPSITVATVFFNRDVQDPANCPKDADGTPDCKFFDDIHMRKVFVHAMNYDSLIKDVLKNHATLVPSVVPRGMFGFDASLEPYKMDHDLAAQELKLSRHPNGFEVKMYFNKGNTAREGTLTLLKQNLEAVAQKAGATIKAEVLPISFGELLGQSHSAKIAIWMLGWAPDYAWPDDYVVPFLSFDQGGTYATGANYKDAEMEALIKEAQAEVDLEKQAKIWQKIQKKAKDDYVYLWLYQTNNIHVEREWVSGYYYNPMDAGQPNIGNYAAVKKA